MSKIYVIYAHIIGEYSLWHLIHQNKITKQVKLFGFQNRGVYMFRVDENTVIDATMAGGPARYVNHSCNPNCFTEVVPTEKGDKIIIIAKRKINSGEEVRNYLKLPVSKI